MMIRVLALAAALALASCGGLADGELENPRGPGSRAANRPATLFVTDRRGAFTVRSDGTAHTPIVAAPEFLFDLSDDAAVRAIGTPTHDLWIQRGKTPPDLIHSLSGRVANATVSPDGTHVAVERVANGPADEVIDLISTSDLSIVSVPAMQTRSPRRLEWSADSSTVWNIDAYNDTFAFAVDVSGAKPVKRKPVESTFKTARWRPSTCAQNGSHLEPLGGMNGADGIDLVGAPSSGQTRPTRRHLVTVHHGARVWTQPDVPAFPAMFFTPDCTTVVFEYRDALWTVDVDSGLVTHIHDYVPGDRLRRPAFELPGVP